jgi:hypothetical protein
MKEIIFLWPFFYFKLLDFLVTFNLQDLKSGSEAHWYWFIYLSLVLPVFFRIYLRTASSVMYLTLLKDSCFLGTELNRFFTKSVPVSFTGTLR